MPFIVGQYDFHDSMALPTDSSDAVSSPCSPSMYPRPPLPTSDHQPPASRSSTRTAGQLRSLTASTNLSSAASASSFGAQSTHSASAFFPYSVHPFSRSSAAALSPSIASTTLASPSSSPVSASTASTSSSSSTASTSPPLQPVSCYPLSAFAAPPPPTLPLPPPHSLDLPAAIASFGRHPSASDESDDDEECSPPVSPALLQLECDLEPSAVNDDDAMDGHAAVTTPVTSLLAAARSFSTAPPIPSLGPSLYHNQQPPHNHSSNILSHSSNNNHHSGNSSHSHHPHHSQNHSHHGPTAHRISKACEACRRRKRKCDGLLPQCTSCLRVGGLCQYPLQTRRRGPQAGMVQKLRAQVSALELELHRERSRNSSAAAAAMAAGNIAEHANIGVLLARDGGEHKAQLYITTYMDLLNSTLFPFVVQSHFEADYARYASSPSTAPPVWHLTVASVLAQGAGVSGDMEYSEEAALIARAAAAPLLDQPSADVIRGLLLLSYHCLSCNQLSRVSCFLAVATRMCAIVDMSPEIPLLCRWLEDMLCAIRTWWRGLRTMPEGSYQKEQRERYPTDWARYERLSAYLKVNQKLPQYASLPGHQHLSSTSAVGLSSSSNMSLTGPPDATDLDDSNIRWEMLSTLCALSEARGEYNVDTHLSVYHHLCVLSKAEYSPLTTGAVATTIAFLKCQALFFVNEISTAIEYARVCTRNMLTHDVSHCAFTSLVSHFMCQVHLKTNDHAHLAIVVSMMRACAQRWKFAEAPLRNIEHIIQHRLAPHTLIDNDDEVLPSDRDDFEPEHALPLADRDKAEEYYHSSVIPHDELREKNRKRKLEREEAEAKAASRQPPSPTMVSALRTQHTFPSLVDTIAGFHPSFKQAFRVSAGVSRGAERADGRTHSPPLSTSKGAALRQAGGELRADHPHPQLSTLNGSTFTLKREEVELDARPEPLTAAPTEQAKSTAVNDVRAAASSKSVVDVSASSATLPPLPAPMSAAPAANYPSNTSAMSGVPAVADTYAWQAGLFSPAVTAISSSAYSTAFSQSHMVGYPPAPPSDQHTVPSYCPITGGSYSSPTLHPFSFNRQNSLDSVSSVSMAPFSYSFDAQASMDTSNATHYFQRGSMDMQMTDDGGVNQRQSAMPPSLSNAPRLQMSHSTPITASMYVSLPSPDLHQSGYGAQTATVYNPVMPPLPHAQSAPQPTSMAPYLYQPPNPHQSFAVSLQPQRLNEVNAANGQFSDQFTEPKRRLTSNNKAAH